MATTASGVEDRRMSIGGVFQRAFSTISNNLLVVLGIAVILGGLPSVIVNVLMRWIIGTPTPRIGTPTDFSAMWGAMLFSWVLAVVVGAIVQGALTRAAVADYEGHRASFGECVGAALRVLLPLILVGLIFGFAVAIGSVLLVVPGIIIMVMWSVAGPAVVVEREGVMAAFRRSQELTSGDRWRIFGLFLVLLVIYVLLALLLAMIGLGGMTATSVQSLGLVPLLANVLMATVFNLLWGTIQPSIYLELRQEKEGGSLQNLEQVFA